MLLLLSARVVSTFHSFPTRRSSDLRGGHRFALCSGDQDRRQPGPRIGSLDRLDHSPTTCERQRAKHSSHAPGAVPLRRDRKSTRLNSSHTVISYAVFCLKKKR